MDALDRSIPPKTGALRRTRLPRTHELTLGNGLRVSLVSKPKLPIVHLVLQLRAGASADSSPVPGLAGFAADMLDEGTASFTALELSDEIDFLGASLSTVAGYDRLTISLNVLSSKLDQGLELLTEIVASPVFARAELERVRERRLTRLMQRLDEPRALAGTALIQVLFGDGHPYGLPLLGEGPSLAKIERRDVTTYYERFVHPGNARLIVVGDADHDGLARSLEVGLGGWRGHGEDPAPGPFLPSSAPRGIHVLGRPGASQSEIRVGRVAVSRTTDDYFPIVVLNTVLGGAFTSRLNRNLREDKGFTYGARSSFSTRVHPGPFVASVAVHTPVTADAIAEIIHEVERIQAEPVPEDELRRARNYVALRFPQRFETVRGVAGQLAEIVLHGLPRDSLDTYVDRIQNVDASEVLSAARRHLRLDDLQIAVVGDREAIEGPLARLDLGDVMALPEPADPTVR